MKKKIIALIAVMWSAQAGAFPEAIHKNYNNCSTCHFSPLGGGPQTTYGKGTTNEIWPTFKRVDLESSEYLVYGADLRRLVRTGGKPILMQQEAHLGLQNGGAAIVGTVDETGPIGLWGSYRSGGVSVRFGRFKPVYAIPYDDHTVPLLNNFKNGNTNNIEIAGANKFGELVITRILGNSRYSNTEKAMVIVGRDELAGTSNMYLSKSCKVGFTIVGSALDVARQALHAQCALGDVYSFGEWTKTTRFALVGAELAPGFHLRFSSFGPDRNVRIGIRWIPVAGVDAIAEVEKNRAFLVTHLWL